MLCLGRPGCAEVGLQVICLGGLPVGSLVVLGKPAGGELGEACRPGGVVGEACRLRHRSQVSYPYDNHSFQSDDNRSIQGSL
eukprot:1157903-Pelagomonas_calceolata.AAC.9